jgi:hypothetical protein
MFQGKGGEEISKRISKYSENVANKRQDEITKVRPRQARTMTIRDHQKKKINK